MIQMSELGMERWCKGCEEWWPDDEEFWAYYVIPAGTHNGRGVIRKSPVRTVRCRACFAEYDGRRQEGRKLRRIILGPVPCQGCGERVFYGTPIHTSRTDLTLRRWRSSTGFIHRCPKLVDNSARNGDDAAARVA